MLFSTPLYAVNNHFDTTGLSEAEQKCYGLAMVGYDSVINSRLGVISDHVFGLGKTIAKGGQIDESDILLFKIVLGAYQWKNSAHAYAIKSYASCLFDKSK